MIALLLLLDLKENLLVLQFVKMIQLTSLTMETLNVTMVIQTQETDVITVMKK